jgi:hypothetical protein
MKTCETTLVATLTGGMMLAPNSCSVAKCFDVKGLSHMKVFIAGATSKGFSKSHALTWQYHVPLVIKHIQQCYKGRQMKTKQNRILTTHVNRLSQNPCETFASVLAERGAMRRQSAQRRSSMCRTGSPTVFQACHSCSSPAQNASRLSIGINR